jgi:hypothetical protein
MDMVNANVGDVGEVDHKGTSIPSTENVKIFKRYKKQREQPYYSRTAMEGL